MGGYVMIETSQSKEKDKYKEAKELGEIIKRLPKTERLKLMYVATGVELALVAGLTQQAS